MLIISIINDCLTSIYNIKILAFIVNLNNASIFLQALAMSMGAFSAVAKSSTLFFSQSSFKSILDDIEEIVDKSNLSVNF